MLKEAKPQDMTIYNWNATKYEKRNGFQMLTELYNKILEKEG